MSSKISSQPAKRARISGTAASSVKGPQDVAEEWAQVNNLVERRRLQNRLSQKNYRTQSFSRTIMLYLGSVDTKARLRQQNSHSIRETRISTRCKCKRSSPKTGEAVHRRSYDTFSEAEFHQTRRTNRAS